MAKVTNLKNNVIQSAENVAKEAVKSNENITNTTNAINGLNQRTSKFFSKEKESKDNGAVDTATSDDGYPGSSNATSSRSQGIQENILHKFASYNTLFTLSGLREEELQDYSFLTNPVHDVVARSAGIGNPNISSFPASADASAAGDLDKYGGVAERTVQANKLKDDISIDVLKDGRDIFFEEVNLLSTVGPSEERGLADFVKMDFKLHEPFGISFVEKMRAAARLNDYMDHLDAPMLLTIEFKGFDEKGMPMPQYGTVRKIPILITRVDLDVNEGGAIYDVQAVRINDLAFDDRFKFPRCEITIDADSLAQAGEQLEKQLNEQIVKEKEEHKVREVLDEYRIEFDRQVLSISKGYVAPKSVQNTKKPPSLRGNNRDSIEIFPAEAQVSNLTSVTKLIEDMVRSTKGYEDLATDFWTTVLRRSGVIGAREDASDDTLKKLASGDNLDKVLEKNPYVDWFKIKTSVQTDYNQFDKINKMHRKIITYKVIPYKIHVLKFMRPGVFMKAGAVKKGVQKQYNYLYTGDNTDIQNLRINYKTAYYMRNTIEVGKASSGVFEVVDRAITRVFGKENPFTKDLTAVRGYPSIVKGRSVVNKETPNRGVEARKQDFYDYLTNPTVDMMRIEMTILGDPAYICQDQFIPLNKQAKARTEGTIYDPGYGSFNVDQYSPLMELVYRLPDDINDKTGLTFDKNSNRPEENLFFAGVYQIVKIESSISNGQFLQTLTCVRLNNQEGRGADTGIVNQAANRFTKAANSSENIGNNTFVEDAIKIQNIEKNRREIIEQLGTLDPLAE